MIGALRIIFSSRRSPLQSFLLLLSEAAAASLCLRLMINTYPKFSMDLPYLVIALPMLGGCALGRAAVAKLPKVGVRVVVVMSSAVIGTAICAGILASFTIPDGFVAVGIHPWAVTGRIPSATSTLSWLIAALAWGRGLLVGMGRTSFRQAVRSAVWVTLLFLVVLITVAAENTAPVRDAVHGDVTVFLCGFVLLFPSVRMARFRDVERSDNTPHESAPTGAWLTMLGFPLVLLFAVALLTGIALGSFGADIAHALLVTVHGLGFAAVKIGRGTIFAMEKTFLGIAYAIRAVLGLFIHFRNSNTKIRVTKKSSKPPPAGLPQIPWPAALGLGAFMLVGAVTVLTRGFVRRLRPQKPAPARDEVVTSLFTWRHLWTQLVAALRRTLRRLIGALRHTKTAPGGGVELTGVRGAYMQFLSAAARNGLGRRSNETPRELAVRIDALVDEADEDLTTLTAHYELARYGLGTDAAMTEDAVASASRLAGLLDALAAPTRGNARAR